MSKQANKTVVGAFVIGALALLVIAVLIFGSGQFFKNTLSYELFFQGTVQGLDVGSPVVFRGVKIGSVTSIGLEFNTKLLVFDIPVTIEIEPAKAKRLGPPPKKEGELLNPLIDKGLRGQLQTLSLVTGQLAVALDFFPNQPARFVSTQKKYPEIPTVPSTFEQITKTIQELPIKELFAKLDSSITAINTLVSSDAAQASAKSMNLALVEATTVMKNIDARIGPLVANLQKTSDSINTVAVKVSDSMSGERGLPAQLQAALEITHKAVAQAEQTLASVKAMTQENSAMGFELGNALSEMSRTLRSLRVMSDYLERHPEALLMGKRD